MKTAMQQYSDFLDKGIEISHKSCNYQQAIGLEVCKKALDIYIEIEKQQIVKAFELGNDLGHHGRLPSGEGYYDKTFKESI